MERGEVFPMERGGAYPMVLWIEEEPMDRVEVFPMDRSRSRACRQRNSLWTEEEPMDRGNY